MSNYEHIILDINDLIPYVNNSRTHSEEQITQVASSIKEFGFTNPVLVDDDNGLIAGHGRIQAAKKLGIKDIPCIVLSGLSEAQKKAYIIADNQLALNAGWDMDMLKVELEGLNDLDFDLSLLGFDDDMLSGLLDEEVEGLTDEDEVPEPPEEPVSVLGDIWQLGNHRLMCGDSTSIDAVEKLMDGQKADMVFTDPPYGYKYESNHQDKHEMLKNDDVMLDFIPAIYSVMFDNSSLYLCGSFQTISKWIEYCSNHLKYKNLIVWKKNNWSMGDLKGSFAGQHELIIFCHKGKVELIGKRDPDVWSFDRVPPEVHPTQKPVELIEYAASKVKSGIVLDVFGGSGSTLMACEKTNRKSFIMELDEKYVDVIINRWQNFTGKEAIHIEQGKTYNELKESNG
ncbi:MAG: DNA modification methylase [Francisellaceae bacterium]|jgi:DNA modification methylase